MPAEKTVHADRSMHLKTVKSLESAGKGMTSTCLFILREMWFVLKSIRPRKELGLASAE